MPVIEPGYDRLYSRITGDRPHRALGLAGVSLVFVYVGMGFLTFMLLGITGPGFSDFLGEPKGWIPELIIGGAVVAYSLFILVIGGRLRKSIQYQAVRGLAIPLFSFTALDLGFRLADRGLEANAMVFLLGGCLLSILAMSNVPGQTRRALHEARRKRKLKSMLDETNWTWYSSVIRNPHIIQSNRSGVWRFLYNLHWLAPAAGMYLARNFAMDVVSAIAGLLWIMPGLIAANASFKEFGLLMALRDWEKESGRSLRLPDPKNQHQTSKIS